MSSEPVKENLQRVIGTRSLVLAILNITVGTGIFVIPALIAEKMGVKAVREIDEKINRLPGSSASYTFHGRDVFAYTAARLASGKIRFQQVGRLMGTSVERINYQQAVLQNAGISGTIEVLDVQYGNVWTNIPSA